MVKIIRVIMKQARHSAIKALQYTELSVGILFITINPNIGNTHENMNQYIDVTLSGIIFAFVVLLS